MSMGLFFRLFLIAAGILVFIQVLLALANRRMVEAYSVSWAILGVGLVIVGCLIRPSQMERYISWPFFFFLLLCAALAIGGLFRVTEHQADMLRKISELSMQVSLLNEENGNIRREAARLLREDERKEESAGEERSGR